MSEFVHLHCHSEYSLLDGLGRVGDLVKEAASQGMPALGLTDHGTMFGAIEFYGKAKDAGVKPILGCEVYVSDRPLAERPGPDARNYHLVLLAENEAGYRNLIKLTTEAHLRGFYRKPRVDHELLERHSEGLICLSGCASSELAGRILADDLVGAEQLADWYSQVFRDRYYLELQYHDLDMQTKINGGVVHLSRKLDLPLVASNDVHYVRAAHAPTHEILLCIQTQTTMADPKRMRLETQEFYLKSAEQMSALFGDFPGALSNTLEIAERCNLNLTFGRPQLPRFETPDGQSSEVYLRHLCEEGLRRRYAETDATTRERLEYELSIIEKTGFVDYFLLVHDVIHFARTHGIAVGPGRGSAAGSLAAYCLFVTNVDPLENGLSFERFLNPERVSMPDMDLDFADDRRDEVFKYVREKYGQDRVAQIITFGTIGPRAGVRDVGRVLGMSSGDIDRVAKLIPFMCNKVSTAKSDVAELQALYDGDPAIKRVLDTVEDLEGVARHASVHAAGVVIARDPLAQHVPLYRTPKNDQIVTQYAMSSVEKIGLLKMDFLGLRTLTIVERACRFVEQEHGVHLDMDSIDLHDPSIYALLRTGETFGVFQVEGQGMRRLLRSLEPDCFDHIVAANALYRPGPMEHADSFCERRHGREPIKYDHPALEEVLRETYGYMVYQEQVMRLFNLIAGYSPGEADLIRRAMAKKKAEELAKHQATFLERCQERGTEAAVATKIWNDVEKFAGYAFNKSHAAAYTVVTCVTAYLKANYPREYLAGLLSAERENAERVAEAMAECRRLGIDVHPPDINGSMLDFTIEGEGIRFGLSAIKHVGAGVIESILATRESGGPFTSLEDFCARVDWSAVNKRVIESLARCGAFDSFNVDRKRILESLDRVVAFGTSLYRAAQAGQVSLFGDVEQPEAVLQLAVVEPASLEERITWEQELLGIAVSRHPVIDAEPRIRSLDAIPVSEVSAELNNRRVSVGGLLMGLRSFTTRDGKPMGTFGLTDMQTTLDAVVFARTYEKVHHRLQDDAIVIVDGKVDTGDGKLRFVVEGVYSLDEAADRPKASHGSHSNGYKHNGNGHRGSGVGGSGHRAEGAGTGAGPLALPRHRLIVEIARTGDRRADLERFERAYEIILAHPGADEVEMYVRNGVARASLSLPNKQAAVGESLLRQLAVLLGEGCVRVEELQTAG